MSSSSKLALVALAAATLSGVDAQTLYHASITQYPAASGTTSGCVEMSCTSAKVCTFSGVVGGLPAAEVDKTITAGKVHVHDGTDCTAPDHWKTTDSTPLDPWDSSGGPSITVEDLTGTLSLTAALGTGQTLADMVGKPLIIHGPTGGSKLGCGLVVAGECPAAKYHAAITQYPAASGTTNGCVEMSCTQPEQVCTFSGAVNGLPAAEVDKTITAGKVHVHDGTDCTNANNGDHWETTDTTPLDPWTSGPSITVDSLTGTLSLAATLGKGQTLIAMVGKPLVIHGPTGGAKLGCGLVVAGACPATTSPAAVAAPASLAALFLAAAAFF